MLSESDVARRRRCTEGARIVFIGTSGLGSMVMRGKLTHSVLKQTFSEHGVKSSYVAVSDPLNSTAGGGRDSAMLEGHFDQIGEPSACIILKYSVAWVGAACRCAQHVRCVCTAAHRTCTACTLHVRWDDQASDLLACRRRGAIVLVDNIDNYRAFKRKTITNEHYAAMDAMLVQTRAHASLLASWGHTAVVLPHSHGEPPVLTRTPWCLRTGLLRAVRTACREVHHRQPAALERGRRCAAKRARSRLCRVGASCPFEPLLMPDAAAQHDRPALRG